MENTTRPMSSNSKYGETVSDFRGYTAFGSFIIPLNLLVFAVLVSDRILLRKSALIAGLTLGNVFLGLFLLGNGAYRLANADTLQKPALFGYCVSTIVSLTYPLAFLTEATFLMLSGIERLLAIKAPHWFRKNWTDRISWRLAGVVILVIFLTLLIGLVAPVSDRVPMNMFCSLPAMYGIGYVLFLSAFAAVGGTLSAALTVLALIAGIRHIRTLPLAGGDAVRFRRQVQLTKSMVTVSCVEVAMVAIPNVFSLLSNTNVVLPSWIRPANSSYTHGVNALVAFFAFLAFHTRFRKAALKLFRAQSVYAALAQKLGIKTSVVQHINLQHQQAPPATELQSPHTTATVGAAGHTKTAPSW